MKEKKEIPDSKKIARGSRVFRVLVFGSLIFGFMVLLFCALVGYDMRRTVAPPPFILPSDLTTASLALLASPPATKPSQSTTNTLTTPTAAIKSTPATTSTLLLSDPPQTSSPPATQDLLPEAALPYPEKQQAARKINAAFRQLQADYASLQREKKKREDPDVPSDVEEETLKKIYGNYRQIVAQLRQNFDPPAGEHFEKVFLGLLIGNRDWRLATWHCVMREDWDGALYCARQIVPREERPLTIAYCSGARAFARIRNLFRSHQ